MAGTDQRCGRCEATSPATSFYCGQCGARLDVQAIDVDLFGDTSGTQVAAGSSTGESSTVAKVAGAVTLVVGLGAVVMFTGGDPVQEPEGEVRDDRVDEPEVPVEPAAEDAVEVSEGASEEPYVVGRLEWELATELDTGVPIGVVDFDASMWLFVGHRDRSHGEFADGLLAWRSTDDGVTWTGQLGGIEPGNLISAVTASDTDIIAVGMAEDGTPTVWRSTDGSSWSHEMLRTPPELVGFDMVPTGVVESDGTLVVAASDLSWSRGHMRIKEAVERELSLSDSLVRDVSVSATAIRIDGPFGLTLWRGELEELALSRDDVAGLLPGEGRAMSIAVWTGDAASWHTSTLEGLWWSDLAVTPDGGFSIVASQTEDTTKFTSPDGLIWHETTESPLTSPTLWRDGTAGVIPAPPLTLQVDTGTSSPVTIELTEVLQSGGYAFGFPVVGSDTGIALGVSGWQEASGELSDALLIHADGHVLAAEDGRLLLRHEGELLYDTAQPTAGVDYLADLSARSIVFVDPDTRQEIASFPFSGLRELESSTTRGLDLYPVRKTDILFTSDLVQWHRNTIADLVGLDLTGTHGLGELHIGEDHLVAVIRGDAVPTFDPSGPPVETQPHLIYTAPLP